MSSNSIKEYIVSNIGQKQIMAVAGLLLCIFLVIHAVGNFLMFLGPEKYNVYSHTLVSLPIVWPFRIGLLFFFLLHVFLSIKVTLENWKARDVNYKRRLYRNGPGNIASRTMIYTGSLLLIWLVWHILTFSAAPQHLHKFVAYDGVVMRDLFLEVTLFFKIWYNCLLYILGSMVVGTHAYHAFFSSFQTLGTFSEKLMGIYRVVSRVFGFIVFICFSSFALLGYLNGWGMI
jgi:succinate dehydrogenase / fumarate reductase cytochrome b subunit